MLEMTFVRVEPVIERVENKVISFIIGAVGRDTESGVSAYIDITEKVSEQNLKELSQWSLEEIRQFCIDAAVKHNFYIVLANQIESILNQPIYGQNLSENI
jgi:hypothetical protein